MLCRTISIIFLLVTLSHVSYAEGLPACFSPRAEKNIASIIATHAVGDPELLTRLVYAEGLSTGFEGNRLVYDTIAWGVMNRVRLGERSQSMQRFYGRGIHGVIFKKGQFNPAISPRSPFSKAFLCPDNTLHWSMARNASETAIKGKNNPFIQTPWEQRNNLSLVVNFYYPNSIQAKGRRAPWERNKALTFIGDVMIGGESLPAERIRFYRLSDPPTDIK